MTRTRTLAFGIAISLFVAGCAVDKCPTPLVDDSKTHGNMALHAPGYSSTIEIGPGSLTIPFDGATLDLTIAFSEPKAHPTRLVVPGVGRLGTFDLGDLGATLCLCPGTPCEIQGEAPGKVCETPRGTIDVSTAQTSREQGLPAFDVIADIRLDGNAATGRMHIEEHFHYDLDTPCP